MGKGKGKKGRSAKKLAAKQERKVKKEKVRGVLTPEDAAKKAARAAARAASREKKVLLLKNAKELLAMETPGENGGAMPTTANMQSAKWPALFKKHMGVLESHVKSLDRTMAAMDDDMKRMDDEERLEWELAERGGWRIICGMMDRARECLVQSKKCAMGILPAHTLRDKKGLGIHGFKFEPLEPKLIERAAQLGYKTEGRGPIGRDLNTVKESGDSDNHIKSDSESSESDSDIEDNVRGGADFVPLFANKKSKKAAEDDSDNDTSSSSKVAQVNYAPDKKSKPTRTAVEQNTHFFVDTEGVAPAGTVELKKASKHKQGEEKEEERPAKKAKKASKSVIQSAAPAETAEPEVDFAALEAKLQAEVEEATRRQEEAEAAAADKKKSQKKRKRSSDGSEFVADKKSKKEQKAEMKRKADEGVDAHESGEKRKRSSDGSEIVADKRSKKEQKAEKKRKADEGVDAYEGWEKRKKVRKHKSES